MKKLKIKKSKIFLISYFIILVFIMSIPLLQEGFVSGDDWEYHLSRIQNISDCLSHGIFPAKIHITSLWGYGYGSGLFYPNFFLYFPAILRCVGLSLSVSYKIFLIVVIVSTIISSYFSTKYIFKSRYAAIIASTLFITSQAAIHNMYLRCAVGETLASIFCPMIVAALYNIIYDRFSKPWILILGFLGLLYSHTISLFLMGLIFALILIIKFKTVFLLKGELKYYGLRVAIKMFISAIAVLLLSISYWLPMLEQFSSEKFNVNYAMVRLQENTLKVRELFCIGRPGLGLPLLLLSICSICFVNKNLRSKLSCKFIFIGLILSFFSTKLFPWKFLNYTIMTKIQFPWRLYTMAAVFLSIGIGGCIHFALKKIKQRQIVLIFLFVVTNIFAVNVLTSMAQPIGLPEDICNQLYSIGGGCEWLPINTDRSKFNAPNQVYASDGESIDIIKRTGNTIYFKYDDNSESEENYFDVPLLFYKGYSATISTLDGTVKNLDVVKSTNNNLCRVINKGNDKGDICVKYSGTKLQHISYCINFLSIVLILIFFKFVIKRWNKL